METQTFQEIVLSKITPNPMNPRKTFAGPKFDELTDSIRQKGVIEPILVRPVKKGFEIVAGERRFRASCRIAKGNGGIDYHTIPAMVRELSDDDAFDIMTIENLQREDLNELEEAEGFKLYLDKKGPEALTTLAERTGISETYIRRRVRILSLPKAVLKKWEKGEMLYGHLEQLMRLGKEERAEIIAWYEEFSQYRTISIGEMKRHIDQSTLKLSEALFDTAAAGCGSCTANTDCQKHLFGDDFGEKETICLNPTCFKRKQAEFLTANWDEYKKKYKSNGFRFEGELKWGDYEMIYGKLPSRDCRACEKLCTIISFGGIAHRDRVCLDPACFKQKLKESDKAAAGESTQEPQRPDWHGRYFREKFYKKRIPEVLDRKGFEPVLSGSKNATTILQAALIALLHSSEEAAVPFGANNNFEKTRWGSVPTSEIIRTVKEMQICLVFEELKRAAAAVVAGNRMGANDRHALAVHLGIDLAKEWAADKEYLNKKTVSELLDFGEKSGFFAEEKVQAYLHEKLLKKRGKFHTCKKGELVELFLKSGVELAGRVPAEILDMGKEG